MTATFPGTITYWSRTGSGATGEPTFGSATAAKARWEDKQEQFIDSKGVSAVSRAVVFLESVDLAPGDWVYNGVSVASTPPSTGFAVRQFNKVPDLRYVRYERKAIL